MKEGAIVGGLIALFVYAMLPIYGNNGAPASMIPTGDAASNPTAFGKYVNNLPFSMVIFLGLEVLGIAAGIVAQLILRRHQQTRV